MPANPDSRPQFKQWGNRINLVGIIVGVVFLLLPKSESTVVLGVAIIFTCSSLLIWNTKFVEEYRPRGVFLTVMLAIVCIWLGYQTRPQAEDKPSQPELSGLLIPANDQTPAIPCGHSLGPRNVLTVALGPLVIVTTKVDTAIEAQGEKIFAITKTAGGIKISARVVGSSNQVVAAISDNVLYVNPSNRFEIQRPDWHSLIVVDGQDKDRKRVLDVYFLNPRFVRAYGDFSVPGGTFVADKSVSLIGSNYIAGNVGPCVIVTDDVPSSHLDFGGITFVAR